MGEPEGRGVANDTDRPAMAVVPEKSDASPKPTVADLPPLSEAQAQALLAYLAGEHGLEGLAFTVEYTSLLPNKPADVVVRATNREAFGFDSASLTNNFFYKLWRTAPSGVDYSEQGLECTSPAVLSDIITTSLLKTGMHTHSEIDRYLEARHIPPLDPAWHERKHLAAPASAPAAADPDQGELALGTPTHVVTESHPGPAAETARLRY